MSFCIGTVHVKGPALSMVRGPKKTEEIGFVSISALLGKSNLKAPHSMQISEGHHLVFYA